MDAPLVLLEHLPESLGICQLHCHVEDSTRC
jgi:hypothetical protein